MRYLVADGAIGPDGRKVRCAHCGHEWWQEGEEGLDEALFGQAEETEIQAVVQEPEEEEVHEQVFVDVPDEELDTSSFNSILQKEIEEVAIPEGVKPMQGDIILPLPAQSSKIAGQRLAGFGAAVLFWAGLVVLLLLMQPQISRAWPPANLFYNLVGLKPIPPGEGLTLSGLEAKFEGGKIVMTGDIINLKDSTIKVPAILASILGDQEKVIDRVLIAPPKDKLKGQEQVSFDVVYPSLPEGATTVNFAFSFLKAERPQDNEPVNEEAEADKEEAAHEEAAPEDPQNSH